MNTTMNGIGAYGALNTSSVSQTKVDKLSSALANTKECNNQELMDVCKDFEAYFLEQVFKSMEKTVMKDEDSISVGIESSSAPVLSISSLTIFSIFRRTLSPRGKYI